MAHHLNLDDMYLNSVNRYVLKALRVLSGGSRFESVPTESIYNKVRFLMRYMAPVTNLNGAIDKALNSMGKVGLVSKMGRGRFCMGKGSCAPAAPIEIPRGKNEIPFREGTSCIESECPLNPNRERTKISEESLSGDEFEKTRKRRRPYKTIKHKGKPTVLPKIREVQCRLYSFKPRSTLLGTNINNVCDETVQDRASGILSDTHFLLKPRRLMISPSSCLDFQVPIVKEVSSNVEKVGDRMIEFRLQLNVDDIVDDLKSIRSQLKRKH